MPTRIAPLLVLLLLLGCAPDQGGQSGSDLECVPGDDAICQAELGANYRCGDEGTCVEAADSGPVDSVADGAVALECQEAKLMFSQQEGCLNDGSVEFCIPPALEGTISNLAPTTSCAPGGGRAGCNPDTQLLCFFPTSDAQTCVTPDGALTDEAWDTLCSITLLPEVSEIVATFAE